ncbi:hypothetical protein F5Y08DRAFT_315773 [Xylaria arbuscula]|nr:hypothetical protein F5Y08DRAFT_315773 [Xylaria arbuscula]
MKPLLMLMLSSIFSWPMQKAIWKWRERAQSFLNDPSKKSRVPQFILDSKHPWVVTNQKKLEQLPDAESYLCFSSRSATGGSELPIVAADELEIPPDLFDYLEIANIKWPVSRPGWPNAFMRAQELSRCPAALSQVKRFKANVYVRHGLYDKWHQKVLEPQLPPQEVVDLFVDVLNNMTSLETLTWRIPQAYDEYFEERFTDRGLILPSVRTLDTNEANHYIVPTCPNITRLEYGSGIPWYGDGREDVPGSLFLRTTMFAPNITQLEMAARRGWDQSKAQELVSYMPGLRSFRMRGGLLNQYTYNDHYGDSDGSALREILQILDSLQNLTQLDLPLVAGLGVGFDGGPECGNAYFGPGGREYEREVLRESLQATERAASIVVETLPRLTSFSIGDDQANITRYENGTSRATFPWTGRINEYVMELLPGGPDGPDW